MDSGKKTRLLRTIAVTAGWVVAAFAYGWIARLTGRGIPCPIHRFTGLNCPGCGMSRVLGALAGLDLRGAFSFNLLWPLYAAYFLFVYLTAAVSYVRRGQADLDAKPAWVHVVVLVIVLGYTVVRNIPGIPVS